MPQPLRPAKKPKPLPSRPERPLSPERPPRRPASNPKPKKQLSNNEQRIFEGLAHSPELQALYLHALNKNTSLKNEVT
jgi:hypothetical protein